MKKTKLITGLCAMLMAGQVMSADLYRDDFDGSWTRIKCGGNINEPDPDGEFLIHDYETFGCVNVVEENGLLTVTTANASNRTLGGGVLMAKQYPELNFFGPATPDPANPHKRVFRFENFNFQPGNLFSFQKVLRFVIGENAGSALHANSSDRIVVTLRENNYFAITATSGGVTRDIFYSPVARVPLSAHTVELELGPTDYKITFLFEGGGLYFNGPHGLDRATWEKTPPDPVTGEATAGNFYIGFIPATLAPFDLDTMISASIDSIVVTDGK